MSNDFYIALLTGWFVLILFWFTDEVIIKYSKEILGL